MTKIIAVCIHHPEKSHALFVDEVSYVMWGKRIDEWKLFVVDKKNVFYDCEIERSRGDIVTMEKMVRNLKNHIETLEGLV